MKNFMLCLLIYFVFLGIGCQRSSSSTKQQTITLYIQGMHCKGCVMAIRDKLKKQKGVTHVMVSLKPQQAVISFDPLLNSPQELAKIIELLKYKASLKPQVSRTK